MPKPKINPDILKSGDENEKTKISSQKRIKPALLADHPSVKSAPIKKIKIKVLSKNLSKSKPNKSSKIIGLSQSNDVKVANTVDSIKEIMENSTFFLKPFNRNKSIKTFSPLEERPNTWLL